MVRDAHDIVTELLAGRLKDTELGDGKVCMKCEEAKLVECECMLNKRNNSVDGGNGGCGTH